MKQRSCFRFSSYTTKLPFVSLKEEEEGKEDEKEGAAALFTKQ